jgi:hypothetical protein
MLVARAAAEPNQVIERDCLEIGDPDRLAHLSASTL